VSRLKYEAKQADDFYDPVPIGLHIIGVRPAYEAAAPCRLHGLVSAAAGCRSPAKRNILNSAAVAGSSPGSAQHTSEPIY
jgi:hypothetical protein